MLDLTSELAAIRRQKPWVSGMFSKVLFKDGDRRLVLIAMEAGARMQEHSAKGTISIHALEGGLRVATEELHPGQVLTIAGGVKHDVEAREECAFLLTIPN